MKAQRGSKSYSSTLFVTSALDGVGGNSHLPAALVLILILLILRWTVISLDIPVPQRAGITYSA